MKKILTLIFILSVANLFAQNHSAKLSPFTKRLLLDKSRLETNTYIGKYVHQNVLNKIFLSGMIKVNSTLNESDIQSDGVSIGTRAGNIWTVQIPLENIEAFTRIQGID